MQKAHRRELAEMRGELLPPTPLKGREYTHLPPWSERSIATARPRKTFWRTLTEQRAYENCYILDTISVTP